MACDVSPVAMFFILHLPLILWFAAYEKGNLKKKTKFLLQISLWPGPGFRKDIFKGGMFTWNGKNPTLDYICP